MDRNLLQILLILGFVFVFGGFQGLYNISIAIWFILGLLILIMIDFFMGDMIMAVLKIIFHKVVKQRR